MQKFKYTDEQQSVLDAKGQNLIVSAQAGAGKTRVLVEKIIQYIDEEHISLENMLIVTFTKKAANEMKNRIREELSRRIEVDREKDRSGNIETDRDKRAWFLYQLNNVATANIQTMHAFCLEVLQEHYDEIKKDPGFHILNDRQILLMKENALNDVIDTAYASDDEGLHSFIERYGFNNRRDDTPLKELILSINREAEKMPDSIQWLDDVLINISSPDYDDETIDLWTENVLNPKIDELVNAMNIMRKVIDDNETLPKLRIFINDELDYINKTLIDGESIPEKLHFERLPSISKKNSSEEELAQKDVIKNRRSGIKEIAESVLECRKALDGNEISEDNRLMYEDLSHLINLTKAFYERFTELKEKENGMDFSDVEHKMIEILRNEVITNELKEKYEYIFFDEYQDASGIQNEIINKIARENNLFFVGDIKQSIYGFRQAEPKNFIKRYDDYALSKNDKAIDLTMNFRSKPIIIHFINFIFEKIMTANRGGVNYNTPGHLGNPRSEDPTGVGEVKLVVIEDDKGADDVNSDDVNSESEASIIKDINKKSDYLSEVPSQAFYVANEILKLTKSGYRYHDCAILFRTKHRIFQYEKVLDAFHIPYYSDSKSVDIESLEVSIFLQLLRVIDNLIQDVPLISILTSIVGGITDDELAMVRIDNKEGSFYEAVKNYALTNDDELAKKIDRFYLKIDKWRNDLKRKPLMDFCWQVIDESGLYSFCSALDFGEERRENLNSILKVIEEYSSLDNVSLYGFLQYIEKGSFNKNNNLPTAAVLSEDDNVVRLMTIHKSKGLEFPNVFLVETENKFAERQYNRPFLYHNDIGVSLQQRKFENDILVTKRPIRFELAKKKSKEEDRAEEVRVLYVAMTRAIDKLYIVGQVKNMDKLFNNFETDIQNALSEDRSYLSWIIDILQRDKLFMSNVLEDDFDILNSHNPEQSLCENYFSGMDVDAENSIKIYLLNGENYRKIERVNSEAETVEGVDIKNAAFIFALKYKNIKETTLAVKKTVSQIAKKNLVWQDHYRDMEYVDLKLVSDIKVNGNRNRSKEKITATEWGTLMHKAFQKISIKHHTLDSITEELDDLVIKNNITKDEREFLDENLILNFFNSELGNFIVDIQNSEDGKIYRERAFTIKYKDEDGEFLVDGQIDLFAETEDSIYLVDFKTDRVIDKEKYTKQISLYAEALNRARRGKNKKVKKAMLYWVRTGTVSEFSDEEMKLQTL